VIAAADRAGLPFVGGHPMAGRETSGYGAADPALFEGRPWVVVPGALARPSDVARIEELARSVGAVPVPMGAIEHDAAVAAISHLPLLLSVALVEAVVGAGDGEPRADWPAAHRLAAGGWRDMTRLARGDVAMGAGIAATNADALAARLRDLRAVLDAWLADLEQVSQAAGINDPAALEERLRNARRRLELS
jgi:prephenate dehydrogenase